MFLNDLTKFITLSTESKSDIHGHGGQAAYEVVLLPQSLQRRVLKLGRWLGANQAADTFQSPHLRDDFGGITRHRKESAAVEIKHEEYAAPSRP